MDQDKDTVQILRLETPCSPAWRTRLQSHLASWLYDLSFPPATSLFCQHMRRPLLSPLRRKMHFKISCPGLSVWSSGATVLHFPVTSMPMLVQIIPPGPGHLVRMEWGTWMKMVNVCLSCALPSISVLQTRILLAPLAPKSHGCTLVLDGSWGGDSWTKSVTVAACILRTATQIMHWSVVGLPCGLENFIYLTADHLLPLTALQPKTLLKSNDFRLRFATTTIHPLLFPRIMKALGQNFALQSQIVRSLLSVAHQESSRTGSARVLTYSYQHLKQSAKVEL